HGGDTVIPVTAEHGIAATDYFTGHTHWAFIAILIEDPAFQIRVRVAYRSQLTLLIGGAVGLVHHRWQTKHADFCLTEQVHKAATIKHFNSFAKYCRRHGSS